MKAGLIYILILLSTTISSTNKINAFAGIFLDKLEFTSTPHEAFEIKIKDGTIITEKLLFRSGYAANFYRWSAKI